MAISSIVIEGIRTLLFFSQKFLERKKTEIRLLNKLKSF